MFGYRYEMRKCKLFFLGYKLLVYFTISKRKIQFIIYEIYKQDTKKLKLH